MKRITFLIAVAFGLAISSASFAQTVVDVVYLKNGSVIRGTIVEQVPGESLKVQTADGSIFVYTLDEVEKMTKEEVEEEEVSRPTGSKKYPVVALGLSLGVPIVSLSRIQADAPSRAWLAGLTGSKKYPVVALGLSLGVPIVSSSRIQAGASLAWLAGLLDGSGQFYNGEVDKGFGFLGLSLVSYGLMYASLFIESEEEGAGTIFTVGSLARVTSYVWASIDAYGSANRINVERGWTTALEPPTNSVYLNLAPEGKGRGGMLSFTHRR